MPIYEYRCLDCRRRVSIFFKRMGADEGATCPRCGSPRLERLWSRFAMVLSEEDRLERLADPANFGDLDENDPKSLARFMRRMTKELGEETDDELEEAIEELERAESFDELEERGEGPEGEAGTGAGEEEKPSTGSATETEAAS